MKPLIAILTLCLCSASSSAGSAQPRGWRGIVVLHSTRADVERLLGPPTERLSGYSDFYRTPKETVIIDYTRGLPCGIGQKDGKWRVPRDTVESILVTFTQLVRLSDLGLDESKYKKRSGGHTPDTYYVDEQYGETLQVFGDEVKGLSYYPGAVDVALLCPGLSRRTSVKCEGLTPPRFRSYGKVSFKREKSLLDNFVITLIDEKDRTGYIIAYAGIRARVGEAKARAERAKKYLVTVRRFPAESLKAIDGGYRKQPEVDLYVVPKGICPPTPDPTVERRDVRTLRDGKTRNTRRSSRLIRRQDQIDLLLDHSTNRWATTRGET